MSTASAVKTSPKKGGLRTFIYSLRALKHRDFRIFWIGALLTNTGKFLTAIAVPIVLYQITGSAVIVGLATTFQYVPGVIMGPIGGAQPRRPPRRRSRRRSRSRSLSWPRPRAPLSRRRQ